MKIIKLSNNKAETMIDDEDFEIMNMHKWRLSLQGRHKKNLYVCTYSYVPQKRNNATIYAHRLIMNAPKGMHVDHINGNCLDNRRSNLRICTRSENQYNRMGWYKKKSSEYKGVSWNNHSRKWAAQICINRKKISLGSYDSQLEAAIAYNEKAKVLHGAFAKINIIPNSSLTHP